MARHKHGELQGRSISNMRLRTSEMICEECGVVYDLRTGVGVCGYCDGRHDELEAPPPAGDEEDLAG